MILVHHLLNNGPATRWGATRGQSDMAGLINRLESGSQPLVVLDYSGIEAANGSYVRSTALWVLRCGIAARTGESVQSNDPWAIRPLSMSGICVAGLSEEVRNDIAIQLGEGKLPCAEALDWDDEEIREISLLGHLDPQLRRAFDCLLQAGGEAVAETLWKQFPADGIGLTGWNNRLAELHQRQLISRKKDGKFWRYFTSYKEVSHGVRVSA